MPIYPPLKTFSGKFHILNHEQANQELVRSFSLRQSNQELVVPHVVPFNLSLRRSFAMLAAWPIIITGSTAARAVGHGRALLTIDSRSSSPWKRGI